MTLYECIKKASDLSDWEIQTKRKQKTNWIQEKKHLFAVEFSKKRKKKVEIAETENYLRIYESEEK